MLYRALQLTVAPVLRTVYRPVVTGSQHVPADGAVLIAGNHVSFADEIFTPIAARRQVFYFAKAEYFTSEGIRGKAMGAIFRELGQVPVERADTRSAAASLDVGVEMLKNGDALGIYPEGTRSPDGRLYKFRTGVARLAVRSGAPVVPVGLVGTREVQPPGSKRWYRAPVAIHFGPPLDFSGRSGDERSAKALRAITDEIRIAVQALTEQEYVDSYASTGREE